jgi:hypothetical protein
MIAATRACGVVLAVLLAVYPLRMGDVSPALLAIAVTGVVLAAAGLTVAPEWTLWAGAFFLGLGYVAALALRGGEVDPFAPAVAVGLYLVVEARDVAESGRAHAAARLWHSLAVGFGAALLVAALLVAGTAVRASGPVAVAVSALCGVVVLSGFAAFVGKRGPARGG